MTVDDKIGDEQDSKLLQQIEDDWRDAFAEAALPGVLRHYDTTDEGLKKAADAAYRCADFMLKRRNRK